MSDLTPVLRVFSGAPWENRVGYCRALRRGPFVFVTGTAPVADDGSTYAPGDAYRQAKRCFEIALKALHDLGGKPEDVARTRMFVTDITQWEAFGRAHGEVFAEHPPATSMIGVSSLIDPAMLIEIEMDAVVAP